MDLGWRTEEEERRGKGRGKKDIFEVFGANVRPFIVGEVTDSDGLGSVTSSEYTQCCGRVTNFK